MSIRDYIKGWGGYDFKPEVYYIDFEDKIDDELIENYCIDNDITLSDKEREKAFKDIKFNLLHLFLILQLKNNFIEKLGFVSTFNKRYRIKELATTKDVAVLVIGSTADTLIVTWKYEDDTPLQYYPIAFVPVVKFDDLYQILFDADFDDEADTDQYTTNIHLKTFDLYKKTIRQFNHEWKTIFNELNKYFKVDGKRQHISKRSDIVGYIPKLKVNKKPKS